MDDLRFNVIAGKRGLEVTFTGLPNEMILIDVLKGSLRNTPGLNYVRIAKEMLGKRFIDRLIDEEPVSSGVVEGHER
jgi:hypothetical protein